MHGPLADFQLERIHQITIVASLNSEPCNTWVESIIWFIINHNVYTILLLIQMSFVDS